MAHQMLLYARMKRAVLAVALVAVSSGVASAGGYLGLGIGTAPAVSAANIDTYNATTHEDGRSGRLIGGYRFGRFAVEGAIGRFDFMYADPNEITYTATQAQISGKYIFPLGDGFGAFGRLGLQKSWFNTDARDSRLDVSGTGLVVGAGMEFRLPTVIDVSIFVDYQYGAAALSNDQNFDFGRTSTRMWTLGATIGF